MSPSDDPADATSADATALLEARTDCSRAASPSSGRWRRSRRREISGFRRHDRRLAAPSDRRRRSGWRRSAGRPARPHGGEIDKVSKQDCGVDLLAIAAMHLATQDLDRRYCVRHQAERIVANEPQQIGLRQARQRLVDPVKDGDGLVAEAARRLGRPAYRIGLAGGVDDRLYRDSR